MRLYHIESYPELYNCKINIVHSKSSDQNRKANFKLTMKHAAKSLLLPSPLSLSRIQESSYCHIPLMIDFH